MVFSEGASTQDEWKVTATEVSKITLKPYLSITPYNENRPFRPTHTRKSSVLTTVDMPKSGVKSIVQRINFQWEILTACYFLEPWEKLVFSTT